MDELHDEKVMDRHGFVVSFDVMSIPRPSDAEIIDAGLLSDNLLRITYLASNKCCIGGTGRLRDHWVIVPSLPIPGSNFARWEIRLVASKVCKQFCLLLVGVILSSCM